MRASRLLSCAALAASLAVLVGQRFRRRLAHVPASGAVRRVARAGRAGGQRPAALDARRRTGTGPASCVIAFGPLLAESFGASSSALPLSTRAVLERVLPAGNNMAGATGIMFAATAMAVIFTPLRTRFATQLFAAAASLGLLAMATSLIGVLLGSAMLASLGLDRIPSPLSSVVAGLLLLGTLAQRGDAGWLSALMGPSAAGSSARGIIAWTVLAPLALALLALAGVRQGFYNLHFAFALLAAAICCGLTAVVLWNAARVERAQQRAERARDAMQLAANRLRLAKSATGIQMWEWLPATREWISIDGAERLDPSTNEYLEAGLARTLRDGKSEFEFPLRRAGGDEFPARNAGCSPPAGASSAIGARSSNRSSSASPSTSPNASSPRLRSRPARRACSWRRAPCPASSTTGTAPAARCCAPPASNRCSVTRAPRSRPSAAGGKSWCIPTIARWRGRRAWPEPPAPTMTRRASPANTACATRTATTCGSGITACWCATAAAPFHAWSAPCSTSPNARKPRRASPTASIASRPRCSRPPASSGPSRATAARSANRPAGARSRGKPATNCRKWAGSKPFIPKTPPRLSRPGGAHWPRMTR